MDKNKFILPLKEFTHKPLNESRPNKTPLCCLNLHLATHHTPFVTSLNLLTIKMDKLQTLISEKYNYSQRHLLIAN